MPDNGIDNPITRKDFDLALSGLETRILQAIAHTVEHNIASVEQRILQGVEHNIASAEQRILDRTHEFVRDAQTELLRGFESFSAAETVQLRRLKADMSNIGRTDQRIHLVERRLAQIERRLLIDPPHAEGPAS